MIGTTTATLINSGVTLNGILSGDKGKVTIVVTSAAGTFANANVGTSKAVTVAGLSLSGSAAANYTITQPAAVANISAQALTVTGITADKNYDGTATATLDTTNAGLSGVVTADLSHVTLASTTDAPKSPTSPAPPTPATYSLTVSGLTISGTAASNYTPTPAHDYRDDLPQGPHHHRHHRRKQNL